MGDDEFIAFVQRNRALGYGRMMHLISKLWRDSDPLAALSVGAAYGTLERRRRRCEAEGHDVHHGINYDWCDRCGAQIDPDTGEQV